MGGIFMRLTSILSILFLSVFASLALAASNSQPLSFAHKDPDAERRGRA